MSYYKNVWGQHHSQYNLFQEYFCRVVFFSDSEDWPGVQELMDELTSEQQDYIWSRLASYTRKEIKENSIKFKSP